MKKLKKFRNNYRPKVLTEEEKEFVKDFYGYETNNLKKNTNSEKKIAYRAL